MKKQNKERNRETYNNSNRLTLGHVYSGHAVPALRGKDYGKTKMRYPDYTETESGLQYKVIIV